MSDSFRVVTRDGDVSVDFTAAPETIDAESATGDIVLALPRPGPYSVDATTGQRWGTTAVRVPQTRDPQNAASVVTVRSDTGDVIVEELR